VSNEAYRRKANLLEAEVGDDLVALEPTAGNCFGMNAVAKHVWRQLEQPRSFGELKSDLLAEFEVSDEQCTSELHELLEEMVGADLIERVS
jgi:hypothetical protein